MVIFILLGPQNNLLAPTHHKQEAVAMDRKKLNDILDKVNPDLLEEVLRDRINEVEVAFLKSSHINAIEQVRCQSSHIFVLGGKAYTGTKGEVVLHLNEYLCLPDEEANFDKSPGIINRPRFVATPRINPPALITSTHTFEPTDPPGFRPEAPNVRAFDVKVHVMSWKLDGSVFPNVGFDWHCIVEGARWYVLPG
jgi:hypothetical protein